MKHRFRMTRKNKVTVLGAIVVLVVGFLLKLFVPEPGVGDVEGRARVIDGDSIVVSGREIRLQGIDAPEGRQMCQRDGRQWACGEQSRRMLRKLTGGRKVFCKGLEIDKHDRLLALCRAGGVDINGQMVATGFAVSYGRFRAEERAAKAAKKGMWAGEFQTPRQWRRDRNIGR
ncbi:MAG: thermonuclease family protein [Alphaproteobacteria bacterium]|nr:thermonuclease family protein [Alphaproteobacteria bacterium]